MSRNFTKINFMDGTYFRRFHSSDILSTAIARIYATDFAIAFCSSQAILQRWLHFSCWINALLSQTE
ncbi:hypothetical protein [Phormidium sp. CCY1219]|uniref:hypothetical protein n=1 Tax=Phormidium sp. CCY1219 TaxID=2886104 RepID=UPI002D1F19F7|nr:hypothetical protein [Phormidium sp. CCY1219]MEB3829292.1 hypothetical protein [Phormidium sp. CCY1219]